jgi:hypothetical protein
MIGVCIVCAAAKPVAPNKMIAAGSVFFMSLSSNSLID